MARSILAFAVAAGIGGLTAGTADAQVYQCMVMAPGDTAENIRLTPNGKVINRLRNGREVIVSHTQPDARGRPWAYVEGEYQGRWRRWGYIFTESLQCW